MLEAALYHITYTASGAHIFPATPRDLKQFKTDKLERVEEEERYRV